MNITRALSLATAILLGGCSSVSKPAQPDGSDRVPANDPTRVQTLQQRVEADCQLLADNTLLRAQVEVLQAKLIEMTGLVREALMLPPAPRPTPSPTAVPTPVPVPLQRPPVGSPQSIAAPDLPAQAFTVNPSGTVFRVFHPFASTAFQPDEQVAQVLQASVRDAELIEVRGYTDSHRTNPVDRRIASERAEQARAWLLGHGTTASKIRTTSFPAGHFLADNTTPKGRSTSARSSTMAARPTSSKPDHDESYFVTLKTRAGEQVIWGKGLAAAMHERSAGEQIVLQNIGRREVTVQERLRNAQGQVVGTRPKESRLNAWMAELLSRFSEKARTDLASRSAPRQPSLPVYDVKAPRAPVPPAAPARLPDPQRSTDHQRQGCER